MEATMNIIEAINQVDVVKPNTYDQSQKIKWLSNLDGIVKKEIIDTHEGSENVTFNGYTDATLLTTKLLIPAPYDVVYIRYLEMQIDYANGEYAKYNNSMEVYNEAYTAFQRYYNRTHMPKGNKFKFF
jgi:hypothetical protein